MVWMWLLAGCPPETPEVAHPEVVIVSPADGATVQGPSVDLTLEVHDFQWEDPERQAVLHGVGDEAAGYAEIRVDGVAVLLATTLEVPLTNVEPGERTIEVELLYSDGHGFFPRVLDTVTLTVE